MAVARDEHEGRALDSERDGPLMRESLAQKIEQRGRGQPLLLPALPAPRSRKGTTRRVFRAGASKANYFRVIGRVTEKAGGVLGSQFGAKPLALNRSLRRPAPPSGATASIWISCSPARAGE